MPIPSSDALRLLNLAYRKMQQDFQVFGEELFRATPENIPSNASGYILIPNYLTELEMIVDQNNLFCRFDKIDRHLMYIDTGYYWDGIDTSSGKRRIMVRERGQAKASANFTVHFLREYADLTALDSVPYPFVGRRYLDLLTELQSYYYFDEQGDDRATEAQRHYNIYKGLLADVRRTYFDDAAVYGSSYSNDAGNERRYPLLNPSQS